MADETSGFQTRREKEVERCDLLRKTATWVCRDLNKSGGPFPGGGEAYFFDAPDLERIVVDYFDAVEMFRRDNFMKSRINESKQAALTILQIMTHPPIKARNNVRNTIHLSLGNSWYAYAVALALLHIEIDSVDKSIASEIQYLIRNRLDHAKGNNFVDLRTLILIMELLERCYARR